MECYICKRTEDEFRKIFLNKLALLESEKTKLENDLRNVKDNFAIENDFTEANKNLLSGIDQKYLELKYYVYLESNNIFNDLDKNLLLLKNYYEKYRPQILIDSPDYSYKQAKQYNEITLTDILNQYLLEPFDERYKHIKDNIEKKINDITPYIEKIKETKNFFFEIDVALSTLYQEFVQGSYYSTSYYSALEPNIFSYTLPNKIHLCPYCSALFNGASVSSFSLEMAEQQKLMDDD
jgi:hypothetical protein